MGLFCIIDIDIEVSNMKLRNTIKEFAIITLGTIIVAAAVFFFMLPSHVSVGSGAALAMVLSNFIPLSVSAITLIMNIGLLLIGFILVGPEFGIKTVYCSILMPNNLKYKSPAQIATVTALQFVYGLGFSVKFFFWVIEVSAYFANIVLGKGSGSGSAPQLFRSVGVVGKIEDELENSRRISRENAEAAEERRIEAEKAYKEKNG